MRTGMPQNQPSVVPNAMKAWIDIVDVKRDYPQEERLRKMLNNPNLPDELVMHILKHSGEVGSARAVFWFVVRECKRKAPWLDCTKDATWRELAIAVFGGPRANVALIDRWKRELDAARAATPYKTPPVGWDTHFYWLYWTYAAMKTRVEAIPPAEYPPPLMNGLYNNLSYDRFMTAVFPRFHEFPQVWLITNPWGLPGPTNGQPRPYLSPANTQGWDAPSYSE